MANTNKRSITSESGFKLLGVNNAKTTKGEDLGVLTGILYLNPAVTPKLCPYATTECRALCLVNAGRGIMKPVRDARTRKTDWFLNDRQSFIEQLKLDIALLEKRATRRGMRAAVRLNGTSDIVWERLIDFAAFPNVMFYDYTKIPLKYRKQSANYHLTFSYSGDNWQDCVDALNAGNNVAAVFANDLPASHEGFNVIDGTLHDVRFLDGNSAVIVGLCAKGHEAKRAAKNGSKFIIAN